MARTRWGFITLEPGRDSTRWGGGGVKDTMSLLQPTSNSVDICKNYKYVMYVLSVKYKRPSIQIGCTTHPFLFFCFVFVLYIM